MNYKMVIHTVGQVVLLEAGLLALPLLVSLYYGESCSMAYLQTIAIAAVVGSLMTFAVRPKNHNVFAKEGFSIVSIGWLILSAIGALPFVFSGDIPSYVDAFFETFYDIRCMLVEVVCNNNCIKILLDECIEILENRYVDTKILFALEKSLFIKVAKCNNFTVLMQKIFCNINSTACTENANSDLAHKNASSVLI